MQPLAIWPGHVLFDPLDTALVQAEDAILTALPLKVGLEFIPGAQIRSTVIAKNRGVWISVGGNSQPYDEAGMGTPAYGRGILEAFALAFAEGQWIRLGLADFKRI